MFKIVKIRKPVKPIKTCMSKNELGVDGVLITGTCPLCGQIWLNNRDNKFCGGCAVPLIWEVPEWFVTKKAT